MLITMRLEACICVVGALSGSDVKLDLWTSEKPEVQSEVQSVSCDEKRGFVDTLDLWTSETHSFISTHVRYARARA